MAYYYLIGAILFEVMATMLLPISANFTKPLVSIALVAGYMVSFYLLTFALESIPIAIAYATWGGLGIFLVTVLSYLIYGQSIQWQSILGLLLIAIGVAIVNTFKY